MPTTKPSGLKRWPMNRVGNTAEIRIYTDIGFWYTSQMFIEQLDQLGNVDVLDVRINSFGGFASEGVAMYNALARHPATKRVWIDGAAYSAATIPAMAASPGELRIAFNARMMIHNAWNMAEGDKNEMRKMAEILDMCDGSIAATFAKRMSKVSKDEILALMDAETWYDADSAIAAGLADAAFDAGDVAQPEDELNMLREFKRPPAEIVEKLRGTRSQERAASDIATAVKVRDRWAAVRNREAT